MTQLVLVATEAAPMSHLASAPGGSAASLAWLIPVVPAVSAALLLLFGKRLGKASAFVAIGAMLVSALLSTWVFSFLSAQPAEERTFEHVITTWLQIGPFTVDWGILVDPLSTV